MSISRPAAGCATPPATGLFHRIATVADTRLDLGRALTELHQFAEAETLLVHAHEVMEQAYRVDSPYTHEAATALDRLHALRDGGGV